MPNYSMSADIWNQYTPGKMVRDNFFPTRHKFFVLQKTKHCKGFVTKNNTRNCPFFNFFFAKSSNLNEPIKKMGGMFPNPKLVVFPLINFSLTKKQQEPLLFFRRTVQWCLTTLPFTFRRMRKSARWALGDVWMLGCLDLISIWICLTDYIFPQKANCDPLQRWLHYLVDFLVVLIFTF